MTPIGLFDLDDGPILEDIEPGPLINQSMPAAFESNPSIPPEYNQGSETQEDDGPILEEVANPNPPPTFTVTEVTSDLYSLVFQPAQLKLSINTSPEISPLSEKDFAPPLSAISDKTELLDHSNSLSFYYECKVGFIDASLDNILQFGIIMHEVEIYSIAFHRPSGQIAFLTLHPLKFMGEGTYTDVMQTELQKLFHQQMDQLDSSIVVHQVIPNIHLKEADVLGCGMYTFKSCVFFTLNGIPIGNLI